jgi:ATP-dependent DNA helicase DinG
MLNHVYDNLKNELEADGIVVLGQGVDGSNQQILEEFKEIHESLLLGTSSFWEGVDVPGDSLQLLFVTKLPFASPSEPIIQARTEAIEKEGGNSFMEYSIPMAVIQFRQGFGRLIRSKNDTGVVFVLDNRVVKTRYGRIFLQSLPLRHTEFRNAKALGRSLKNWLLSH